MTKDRLGVGSQPEAVTLTPRGSDQIRAGVPGETLRAVWLFVPCSLCAGGGRGRRGSFVVKMQSSLKDDKVYLT